MIFEYQSKLSESYLQEYLCKKLRKVKTLRVASSFNRPDCWNLEFGICVFIWRFVDLGIVI